MKPTNHRTNHRILHCSLAVVCGSILLSGAAIAQTAAPTATRATAAAPIGININGRTVETDPVPILRSGSVFVPLRGVLENLGAKVNYDAATSLIDITQAGKRYSLRVGQATAAVENIVVPLASAPISISGRTFVPLRSLAELFGFDVSWQAATRTVVIAEREAPPTGPVADHRAALAAAGRYGVGINFHDSQPNEVEPLLDAAKKAGAGLVKFRFDWSTLEPTKGSAFQWSLFDRVVRGARERDLTVVGVLGNTTRWATLYPRSENVSEWRNSPPKTAELPAWENYVRRVVGRYRNDVHAWQVWENPATHNFRSVAKDYRIVARRAVDAVRFVDKTSVVFVSEPGGVNLGFIEDLRTNGLTPRTSGVAVYPVSQWQPGVQAQAEEMVLPLTTLLRNPLNRDQQFWVHGLSRLSLEGADLQDPRAEAVFNTEDHGLRKDLAARFTPEGQADYLVRAMALSLATGAPKVFWGSLRDEATYDTVDPVNSLYGGGLLRRDMTTRPSYDAYSQFVQQIGSKQYVGALDAGPESVVLIFEDDSSTVGVAWAMAGHEGVRLALHPQSDPGTPGATYVATSDDTKVLNALGREVGEATETLALTQRPVWITDLSFRVPQAIRDRGTGNALRLITRESNDIIPDTLTAVFAPGEEGVETGLYWRKYLGFRGAATEFEEREGEIGLKTTFSRDVYNPSAGQPNIYLDVANNYLYFARGVPVRITVIVKRPAVTTGPFAAKGGFNLQYDSPSGFKMTPWQVVEGGDDWATFEIDIPDASFANRDGFDLMINTWGARQDLVFRSLTLEKVKPLSAETAAAD